MSDLHEHTITFGKYKDLTLERLLRDRKYCRWLIRQEWFSKQYEYLYNKVIEYNPITFFVDLPKYTNRKFDDIDTFVENYPYFHLINPNKLPIELSVAEQTCYRYYLHVIDTLKNMIIAQQTCNIKAPSSWLKKFEKETELSRETFKEFLYCYDLPNIPYIVEDIKKVAGIDYKGARSYIIAKDNSLKQESYWENILKTLYGEDISLQFKYKTCVFDFINIKLNTIYECKIGIKDFDIDQYRKYQMVLGEYEIIYLISDDCIIDIANKTLYTPNSEKYILELFKIPQIKEPNPLETIIVDFEVCKLQNITDFFLNNKWMKKNSEKL